MPQQAADLGLSNVLIRDKRKTAISQGRTTLTVPRSQRASSINGAYALKCCVCYFSHTHIGIYRNQHDVRMCGPFRKLCHLAAPNHKVLKLHKCAKNIGKIGEEVHKSASMILVFT